MNKQLTVLVVGCGHMGASHAKAYHNMPEFEIVGLVSRKPESREKLSLQLGGYPCYEDFEVALIACMPDIVSINTYPDTHYEFAKKSLDYGAHVFLEKPIATTVEEARQLVDLSISKGLKLVIGYILRVHPTWQIFISKAQNLGKPLVMRMNLNQQSSGANWITHKALMNSMSPIVDCGVHYIDIMCQITNARPFKVHAIGVGLSEEISHEMYNYGQLQVCFDDGSIGWYEAGWGPMISETAYFIKDVIGPKGAVSIVDPSPENTDDIDGHTRSGGLKIHHGALNSDGNFDLPDDFIQISDEPGHDQLCQLEQEFLLDAIIQDLDLSKHLQDAVSSLQVVLAADQSVRTGEVVSLD